MVVSINYHSVFQVFDILPQFGTLQPGESQVFSFTFYGHSDISAQAQALCEVYGGPVYEMTLHGEASLVRYTLSTNDIDCGVQVTSNTTVIYISVCHRSTDSNPSVYSADV